MAGGGRASADDRLAAELAAGKVVSDAAAAMARDTAYIPASLKAQVLANTALAGPGETVEVTFTAPKAPGKYQYLCSFAGHFQAGMTGWLVVK